MGGKEFAWLSVRKGLWVIWPTRTFLCAKNATIAVSTAWHPETTALAHYATRLRACINILCLLTVKQEHAKQSAISTMQPKGSRIEISFAASATVIASTVECPQTRCHVRAAWRRMAMTRQANCTPSSSRVLQTPQSAPAKSSATLVTR